MGAATSDVARYRIAASNCPVHGHPGDPLTAGGKRPRAGRPKSDNPKDRIVGMRLTNELYTALDELAEREGTTVSAVILAALQARLRKVKK